MDPNHAALHTEVASGSEGFKRGFAPVQILRFSEWAPKPLPDSKLTRRVKNFPWSRGFWIVVLFVVWLWTAAMTAILFRGNSFGAQLARIAPEFVLVFWGVQALVRSNSKPAPLCLVELQDDPTAIAQYPVEVRYSIAGVKSGFDRGIVSFFDGWLHFQGRRTSWSLRVGDATFRTKRKFDPGDWRSFVQQLRWRHNGADFLVEILAYDQMQGAGRGLRNQMRSAFGRWLQGADWFVANGSKGGDKALEHYTMPPASPMPETAAKAEFLRRRVSRLRWVGIAFCLGFYLYACGLGTIAMWSFGIGALLFAIGQSAKMAGARVIATFAKYCD